MVSQIVVLDAGPLGLVTNPNQSPKSLACTQWLHALIGDGARVLIPEIADYEVRRELIRANRIRGIARLDALAKLIEYLPITTSAMQLAAEFWARARQQGQPTAGDNTIDADMILAARALSFDSSVLIATTNVGHLSRFVSAEIWPNIRSQ